IATSGGAGSQIVKLRGRANTNIHVRKILAERRLHLALIRKTLNLTGEQPLDKAVAMRRLQAKNHAGRDDLLPQIGKGVDRRKWRLVDRIAFSSGGFCCGVRLLRLVMMLAHAASLVRFVKLIIPPKIIPRNLDRIKNSAGLALEHFFAYTM